MKFRKNKYHYIILVVLLQCSLIFAKQVDIHLAKKVAKNWHEEKSNKKTIKDFDTIIESEFNNHKSYYIFAYNDGGFVIVSADDVVIPILGYSINSIFDETQIPIQLTDWLINCDQQIDEAISMDLDNSQTVPLWEEIANFDSSPDRIYYDTTLDGDIAPLVSTNWSQGRYYNTSCPVDAGGSDGHVYVGCVATAMGQIMKYWDYPTMGTGSHSYDHPTYGTLSANFGTTTYGWASMPDPGSASSYNTSLATLLYHCGVSVDMDYGPTGSGAVTAKVATSLQTYFGYASSAQYVQRSSYTEIAWNNLLIAELNAGRPMQYRGSGASGGHSFICDGYQGTDYFHFNWGWNGYADGYFYLSNLNPGSYTYTTGQSAIVGIQPGLADPPSVTTNAASSISQTSATLNGNVTSDGGATITQRGFYYSQYDDTPDSGDNWITESGTTGSYSSIVPGLDPNTLYYFRAFAINSMGTGEGSVISFTTETEPEIISINPNNGTQGTNFPVTITGLNTKWYSSPYYYFANVFLSGTGVTVSSESIINNTTIQGNMSVLGTASTGVRTVNVDSYHDGINRSIISLVDGFTVNPFQNPEIISTNPNSGMQGTSFPVTITGLNTQWLSSPYYFVDVLITGTGVEVSSETIINNTTIQGNMDILGAAPTGVRTVDVDSYHDGVNRSIISLVDGFTVNESFVRTSKNLLVADFDNSINCTSFYTDALDANGHTYDVWNYGITPTSEVLNQYLGDGNVIWFTSNDFQNVLISEERTAMQEYLLNGGNLFFSGQDLGYYCNDRGILPWYNTYFYSTYVQDNINLYGINGVVGNPITNGLDLLISPAVYGGSSWWPSEIDPISPAVSIFHYDPNQTTNSVVTNVTVQTPIDSKPDNSNNLVIVTGISSSGTAAIKVDNGVYKLVYLAFGFESITDGPSRAILMDRILNWFKPPSPCNQNGAIIYNTETGKFNFCENGFWVEK